MKDVYEENGAAAVAREAVDTYKNNAELLRLLTLCQVSSDISLVELSWPKREDADAFAVELLAHQQRSVTPEAIEAYKEALSRETLAYRMRLKAQAGLPWRIVEELRRQHRESLAAETQPRDPGND